MFILGSKEWALRILKETRGIKKKAEITFEGQSSNLVFKELFMQEAFRRRVVNISIINLLCALYYFKVEKVKFTFWLKNSYEIACVFVPGAKLFCFERKYTKDFSFPCMVEVSQSHIN